MLELGVRVESGLRSELETPSVRHAWVRKGPDTKGLKAGYRRGHMAACDATYAWLLSRMSLTPPGATKQLVAGRTARCATSGTVTR